MRFRVWATFLMCAVALISQGCENNKNTVKTPVPQAPAPNNFTPSK